MHGKKIIHRDIKSLNLFIDANDNIKVRAALCTLRQGPLGTPRSRWWPLRPSQGQGRKGTKACKHRARTATAAQACAAPPVPTWEPARLPAYLARVSARSNADRRPGHCAGAERRL